MFRSFFENNGTTNKWKKLYCQLSDTQKVKLLEITSLTVAELRRSVWPEDLKEILEFYLIKHTGKVETATPKYEQISIIDDSDIYDEN